MGNPLVSLGHDFILKVLGRHGGFLSRDGTGGILERIILKCKEDTVFLLSNGNEL